MSTAASHLTRGDVDRTTSEAAGLDVTARSGPSADLAGLASYPGAKSGSGVAHRIIQQMPPHAHYVEAFVGSGAILRAKRPAPGGSVGIDVCERVCDWWRSVGSVRRPDLTVIQGNAVRILPSVPTIAASDTLVYLDPPYLRETRTRRLYDHEFWTEVEHRQLLLLVLDLRCMVMVSGYPSTLYATMLERSQKWRWVDYPVMTRGGRKIERLWCNFPPPSVLHDPRFGGTGFRDRERVKRKRARWARKFSAMPAWERQLVREALDGVDGADGRTSTTSELARPSAAGMTAAIGGNGEGRSTDDSEGGSQ